MTGRKKVPGGPAGSFAAGVLLLVGGLAGWRAWPRLWDWHFGGLDTQGADSVWNQEPFNGLLLVLRTGVETLLIAILAGLVSYYLTLGLLRFARFFGQAFAEGWRRVYPKE
jgi:hypothetical protein